MKVVFKIGSPSSLSDFNKLLEAAQKDCLERGNTWYRNMDQKVSIEGDTLTVEGQRCALWTDEYSEIMKSLKVKGFRPVQYETSDKRLEWHETMMDFIATRASEKDFLKYCEERFRKGGYSGLGFLPSRFKHLLDAANCIKKRGIVIAGASYNASELVNAKRLLKCITPSE